MRITVIFISFIILSCSLVFGWTIPDDDPKVLSPRGSSTKAYVIITTNSISAGSSKLSQFVADKMSRGFNVHVVTESLWGGGTGDTAAENIRNWLKNNYLSLAIEYVLFIGNPHPDTGDVPMKMLWPRNNTTSATEYKETPSDDYYADLTGNWDLDNDGKYGEWEDDFGEGGVDRNYEVIVGRIPYYGVIEDLDSIFTKIISYSNEKNIEWRNKVLLAMNSLNDSTPGYHLGESIKNDIIDPKGWNYHRMYAENYDLIPVPETVPCSINNFISIMDSSDFGAVFTMSHGATTVLSDIIDTSNTLLLQNNHPEIFFLGAALNAHPETNNNLAYTILKNGAVASIGRSRVGWYSPGQTNFSVSPSEQGIMYEYAIRLIRDEMTVGYAMQEMKKTLIPASEYNWMNFTGLCLYGDPEISLKSRQSIPSSIDWSQYDSPVKSLGSCGGCWAFSATALVENLGNQVGLGVEQDLSEQTVISCIPTSDCEGGSISQALTYIRDEGIPPESCYPYISADGNCEDKCASPAFLQKITQFTYHWGVAGDTTVYDLKTLLQTGPVIVTIKVPSDNSFISYSGGIYDYNGDGSYSGYLSLLIVAYNDDGQFFTVKNSWGKGWGENGYCRIAYNDVTDDIQFGSYAYTASGVYVESLSDTTPPIAPNFQSANPSPNIWTTDPTVEISWNPGQDSESGVAGYSYNFNNSASFDPDSTVDTAGTQLELSPLPPGSSEYYFHIRTLDNAGNTSPTLHVGPFKIDNLPPTGSININNNAASTSSPNVTLSISAADSGSGLSQMAFSNDNINWSSPVPYAASADWTLSSGLGIKTVYARFSDMLGNWTSISITDSITLESVSGPNTPTGLRGTSGSHAVTLQWDEPFSAETEGYHIYRSDAENGFYVQLTSEAHYNPDYNENERKWQQLFTDENLINGLAYWYKITAVNSGAESDATAPVKALPLALTGGDFRLELMESSAMVAAGDSVIFHIVVTGEDRFAETVSLSATGTLPSGISKTFTGNPVKPTGMAGLRLDIPYSAVPGDYTFTITGISENRSHHSQCGLKIVNIATGQGRITALPQKESYRLGEKAEIYGQLLPWQVSGTAVTVQVRKSGELQWTSSPSVIGENSAFRFSYLPQETGEYEVRASWVGNAHVAACESEISAFTVTRGRSEIRVTTATPAPDPGDTVSIGIELSPPYEGQPLYFEILKPGLNVPETVEGLFTQSGGKRSFNYTLEENLPGIWKFKAAWGGNEDYTGSVSLPLVLYPGIEVGHALILAGGGMDQNTLWKTTEFLANRFYQILQKRRFDHDQIYYISDFTHNYDLDGNGTDDIFVDEHSPTVGILQNYLENLYRPGQEPLVGANRPLILYLADHGGIGQFKINAGQYLKAQDLDIWLDALQTATGCKIVIIAEACHSGTFIEKLAATGDQQRILISSSNTEVANYDQDGIQSFSRFFFDQIAQGDSLRNCFFKARKEMGNYRLFKKQEPQIRNELAAADFYIGGTFVVGDILPEIISLTPNQIINAGNHPLFVEGADAEGLESAWVSIIPPGFETLENAGDFQTPLYSFDRAELSDPDNDNRFEGNYNFPYNGDYILTFFVQDTGGNTVSQEIRLSVENGVDPPAPGNVNGDETVDLADAVVALKIACGINAGSVNTAADVNRDGKIGVEEAVYILRKVSGQ